MLKCWKAERPQRRTGWQRKTKPALWTTIRPQTPVQSPNLDRTRTAPLRSRRINRVSNRQQVLNAQYERTKQDWWPTVAGSLCPVMMAIFGKRRRVERKPHHIYGRLGALLCDTRYWLAVSAEGHRFIHDNEDMAREHGWLCPKGHFNTMPGEKP